MPIASTPVGDAFIPADRIDEAQDVFPLELHLCLDCGLLQLLGVIDPEIIYRDYLYETSISIGLVEHFRRYGEDVLSRLKPPENSLVIDIGSNEGALLRAFKNGGMRVLGIEPAREIAQRATESGVESIPDFFNTRLALEVKHKYGPARIITANNVLANVDDLSGMIEGIRELLAPDGVFVFETGYMVDLIQNTVIDNVYHEHLCYFSVKSLAKLFDLHGMELIEVDRVPTKGGSIRGMAQLINGARTLSHNVTELKTLESELGFDRLGAFKAFASRVETIKEQLVKLITDLKGQEKTIAGYGASVGVTTLLYYLDIGNVLSYLVDDNPTKHNMYSPGHHLPVLPSEQIYERKPDYVLILAWRYADRIMTKHRDYTNQGHHFILPLPSIEVI